VDRIDHVLAAFAGVAANAKAEIERLHARQRSAERAGEQLERYVLRILQKRNGQPLRGNNVTFSARRSESLIITDPELVPDEWKRTTVSVDIPKDPLKRAIKDGQDIPGVTLRYGEHLVRR
jgi:hypothetical protein